MCIIPFDMSKLVETIKSAIAKEAAEKIAQEERQNAEKMTQEMQRKAERASEEQKALEHRLFVETKSKKLFAETNIPSLLAEINTELLRNEYNKDLVIHHPSAKAILIWGPRYRLVDAEPNAIKIGLFKKKWVSDYKAITIAFNLDDESLTINNHYSPIPAKKWREKPEVILDALKEAYIKPLTEYYDSEQEERYQANNPPPSSEIGMGL